MGSNLNGSILATLAYFDVFDYPLTRDEIFLFLASKYELDNIEPSLSELIRRRKIYVFDNFYTLKNNPALITRRKKADLYELSPF